MGLFISSVFLLSIHPNEIYDQYNYLRHNPGAFIQAAFEA